MNAKELFEAARNYTNWSLPHGHPEKGFCAWLLSDTETARRHRDDACEAMAQHILSTVRPDDDEPVTRERLEVEPGWRLFHADDRTVLFIHDASKVNLAFSASRGAEAYDAMWIGGFVKVKSLGHLRRLVAALGE